MSDADATYRCDRCSILLAGRAREEGKPLLCVMCAESEHQTSQQRQEIERRLQDLAAAGERISRWPIRRDISMYGRWRVYFNRHGAWPLMWCVSPESGQFEIAVQSVQIATIAETVYSKKDTPDDDDGKPSAWISVEGQLTVLQMGHATIGEP